MSLNDWLNHYARQAGYTVEMKWQAKLLYYVVFDEDGVICDWRPVYEK